MDIPVHRDWLLNERHYGALQGLHKAEAAKKNGAEIVQRPALSGNLAGFCGKSMAKTDKDPGRDLQKS